MYLIKNTMLFIVAVLLLSTVGLFGLVYSLFHGLFNFRRLSFSKYFGNILFSINVGIDKIGNVLLGEFLNKFAAHDIQHKFGNKEETISFALANNRDKLKPLGEVLYNLIEFFDNGHFDKLLEK